MASLQFYGLLFTFFRRALGVIFQFHSVFRGGLQILIIFMEGEPSSEGATPTPPPGKNDTVALVLLLVKLCSLLSDCVYIPPSVLVLVRWSLQLFLKWQKKLSEDVQPSGGNTQPVEQHRTYSNITCIQHQPGDKNHFLKQYGEWRQPVGETAASLHRG